MNWWYDFVFRLPSTSTEASDSDISNKRDGLPKKKYQKAGLFSDTYKEDPEWVKIKVLLYKLQICSIFQFLVDVHLKIQSGIMAFLCSPHLYLAETKMCIVNKWVKYIW